MAKEQRKPHEEGAKPHGEGAEPPDIDTVARMILSGVARMEEEWGAHKIAAVLCGSEASWLVQKGLDELSVHGLLDHLAQLNVIAMLGALEDQGLIRRGPHKTLKLTLTGSAVMMGKRELSEVTRTLLKKARIIRTYRRPAERYDVNSPTARKTLNMLRSGLSPRMIAEKRDLVESTVADHLLAMADHGERFDLTRHLDVELLEELREKAAGWQPGDAIKPIREALDEEECDWARLKIHLIQVSRE